MENTCFLRDDNGLGCMLKILTVSVDGGKRLESVAAKLRKSLLPSFYFNQVAEIRYISTSSDDCALALSESDSSSQLTGKCPMSGKVN